jgi:hypothetical protein
MTADSSRRVGHGAFAWLMVALVSCGDFDLPRRDRPTAEAAETWDDPWGVADTEGEGDDPPGHGARLGACEDVAYWERLFARAEEERLAVENDRLGCLSHVNEGTTRELREGHPDPDRVDRGVAEHRDFADLACGLLQGAWAEPDEPRWLRCVGDMELALGRLFGAHAGLEDRSVGIARQPWLYADCDDEHRESDEFLECVEQAVDERLERVARELASVGAGAPEDIAAFRRGRALAEVTCAAFLEATRGVSCPVDWLVLGRRIVDRHVE